MSRALALILALCLPAYPEESEFDALSELFTRGAPKDDAAARALFERGDAREGLLFKGIRVVRGFDMYGL